MTRTNNFIQHQYAIEALTATNINIAMKIVTKGKGAYEINNADREKGRVHGLGRWMDGDKDKNRFVAFSKQALMIGAVGGAAFLTTAL